MKSDIIYQDKLLEVNNSSILLKNYYFPSMRPKEIAFSKIKTIQVKRPTFWNGKWRFQGTGDFRTWFPLDRERNKRDNIFILTLKNQWMRIGFTAEDSEAVKNIFKDKKMLN